MRQVDELAEDAFLRLDFLEFNLVGDQGMLNGVHIKQDVAQSTEL